MLFHWPRKIMKSTSFPPTVGRTTDSEESTEPSPSYNHLQMEHLRQKNLPASIIPYTLHSISSLAPAEIMWDAQLKGHNHSEFNFVKPWIYYFRFTASPVAWPKSASAPAYPDLLAAPSSIKYWITPVPKNKPCTNSWVLQLQPKIARCWNSDSPLISMGTDCIWHALGSSIIYKQKPAQVPCILRMFSAVTGGVTKSSVWEPQQV